MKKEKNQKEKVNRPRCFNSRSQAPIILPAYVSIRSAIKCKSFGKKDFSNDFLPHR